MSSSGTSVVLSGAVRTPMGRFGGKLASLTAPELGAHAGRAVLARTGVKPSDVAATIMGNARQAGVGPNPARQIAHLIGIPDERTAYTVNMACASGLRSIVSAWQEIELGVRDVVLVGGSEAMSRTPYLLGDARWGHKMGHQRLTDGMYRDGFLCPLCDQIMGDTAENLAVKYGISRAEQDAFAAESQQRCERARARDLFKDEIAPVSIEGRRGTTLVERDEHPRDGVTAASLAKLPPVFRDNGTVHAGSSSGIVDGAAAMLVMSEQAASRLGVRPMARLVAWADAGVDPAFMGIGPVPAIRKLLDDTGVRLEDIDLIELNEAFAAQAIACQRELSLDMDRVNVNGGAIPLGHPIGATGARIVVTLLYEMRRRKARLGMATLCVSGGLGFALLVENMLD